MPVPTCNLTTHRPTPTTVSYTVSTRAPLRTFSARALHAVSVLVRILIASLILLVLWAKWRATFPNQWRGLLRVEDILLDSSIGSSLVEVANGWKAIYLVPLSLLGLYICSRRGYTGSLPLLVIPSHAPC